MAAHPCRAQQGLGFLTALFGGTHLSDHWFPRLTLNPECVRTRNPQRSNTQLPKRLLHPRLRHRHFPLPPRGSPIDQPQNLFRFMADHSVHSSPFSATVTANVGSHDVPRKIPKTPAQGKHLCLLRATKWGRTTASPFHYLVGRGRSSASGWFLPEPGRLVLAEWLSRRTGDLCVYPTKSKVLHIIDLARYSSEENPSLMVPKWRYCTSKPVLFSCDYRWQTLWFDLGNRDGVCAIQSSREGFPLAIGAALGDVWYADACVYFLNTKM